MDLRAREVEVGLFQVGLSRENQRVQTFELGFQAGHLLTLRLQIGLGLGHLRAGHAVVGGQGGDALFGDITRLAQGLCAAEIELGAIEGRLAGGDVGLAGGNQAGLLVEFALRLGAFGLVSLQGGEGALARQAEIGVFQHGQELAGLHVLVVTHQHLFDACIQLAGDASDLALHVSVVRALVVATDQQPLGEQGAGDQHQQDHEYEKTTLQFGGHA